MSSNGKEITLPQAAAQPSRVGQGTVVEQSRAIAEVQGAIIVAQRVPRNVAAATTAMVDSCKQTYMAERSKFRYSRGGTMVTGISVYLARELARCWGNVQYGVDELRRDDEHGQSEMLAWAWDVQTNTRVSTKFIVPHMRDRSAEKGGPIRLTDMRDIYESNANAGARRVRECILNILPPWYVDQAKQLCEQTLRDGGGAPLPLRIATTIATFAEMGVTQQQLERKQGRGSNAWTVDDVAVLTVLGRSLRSGETTKEEEFEPDIPSAKNFKDAESVPDQKPAPAAEAVPAVGASVSPPENTEAGAVEDDPAETADEGGQEDAEQEKVPNGDAPVSRLQVAELVNLLNDNEVKTRNDQLAVVSLLVDERVAGLKDLRVQEHAYLMKRIPELVAGGDFAGTIARARQAANA
ncbi:hypothetical protein [Amycolatopsis sp. NPDC004378]